MYLKTVTWLILGLTFSAFAHEDGIPVQYSLADITERFQDADPESIHTSCVDQLIGDWRVIRGSLLIPGIGVSPKYNETGITNRKKEVITWSIRRGTRRDDSVDLYIPGDDINLGISNIHLNDLQVNQNEFSISIKRIYKPAIVYDCRLTKLEDIACVNNPFLNEDDSNKLWILLKKI